MASCVTFSERIVFLLFLRMVAEYKEESMMAFTEERRREKGEDNEDEKEE